MSWRTVGAPNPASGADAVNLLEGVSCTVDTNCWAVGASEEQSSGVYLNEVLHWTGRRWFGVAVPEPAGTASDSENFLLADRCVSPSDCWAVGDTKMFGEPEVNQILHWTGRKWFVAG